MFLRFAVRDTVLLVLCVLLWQYTLQQQAAGLNSWVSIPLQVGVALLTTLVGFLVHEWGHLLGALAYRGKVHAPHRWYELFLFHFDGRGNNARQFIAMSVGGFIASGLVVAVLVTALPLGTLAGLLALVFGGLGVLATFVLEFPTTWRVMRGGPLPSGFVYEPFAASPASR
jgi:hypothetical protein